MEKLAGKVAFVTGGARGQGRAHAVRLAEEGADIVVCDIAAQIDTVPYPMSNEADLAETAKLVEAHDRRCVTVRADARDLGQMQDAARHGVLELGRIDIAVVNHGICTPIGWDADVSAIEDVLDVNLKGVLFACKAVIPYLIDQNAGGSIVLTSSVAGIRPMHGLTVYAMAKHGVIGLMRCLAAELGPHRIRVNAVCPGGVDTPMVDNDPILSLFCGVESGGTKERADFAARSLNLLPQAWAEPRDIANAVAWLASDEARFVTGITMPVDMGCSNQPPGIPPVAAAALSQPG